MNASENPIDLNRMPKPKIDLWNNPILRFKDIDIMNCVFWLIYCQIIHFTTSWELPPAQFLIDFANLHHRKSITIYLPENVSYKPNLVNWNNIFIERYRVPHQNPESHSTMRVQIWVQYPVWIYSRKISVKIIQTLT